MKVVIEPKVGLGQTVTLEVEPHELVKNVKERASVNQAYEPGNAALSYEGKVLDDNRRLKEYGIKEGCTLNLLPKHQEGGYDPPLIFYHGLPMDFSSRIAHESNLIRARGLPVKPLSPYHWIAHIEGRGKWKGKRFRVEIKLPRSYPFSPPRVEWKSPMRPSHPNIFPYTGWVCLNILDKDWRPEYTLITVVESLGWLLEHPKRELLDRAIYTLTNYTRRRSGR
jgi:ubiquitin-protein ligase